MSVLGWSGRKRSLLVPVAVIMTLLVAIACGPSATATPEGPDGSGGETEPTTETGGTTPTATPESATEPSGSAKVADKLIITTPDWGNERFDDYLVRGEGGVYQRLVHDFLIHGKEGRELAPGVAKSWEFSPDGLTWTFQVQEGITFHNGEELTAEDVAYSLETAHGPEAETKAISPTNQNISRATEPFEATGPMEVSVELSQPQTFLGFYLSEMFAGPRAVIFSEAYREEVGRDGYNDAPTPGTTGPFTLADHVPGSLMRFEKYEDYWKIDERDHKFNTLELRLISELSTRMAGIRSGELDLAQANLEVRDQVEGADGKLIFAPEANYAWFLSEGCWTDAAVVPCDQKEFRQALDYAIDKELIVDQLYGEMAQDKGWAHVTPSSLGYEPDLDSWPYDPEKAKQLLADIGCENASCFPDPYKLYTWDAAAVPFMSEVAQLVCQMWEENLGVKNCEVEVGDSVSIKDKMHSFSLAGSYVIRPNEDRFDGGSIMWSGYASSNPTRGNGPSAFIDTVNEATSFIGTMEERHQTYHEMYVEAREQHWEWSLFTADQPWAAGPKVSNWDPWPMLPYANALWTVEFN